MDKREILYVVLLVVLGGFIFQGSRGLYETSEGRYAECAREMLEQENFLEPTLGYHPHWSKPPLTYWCIAGGMELLGHNEWGVRLYNSIAFFLTSIAVYLIGRALWDHRTGLVAGLIYGSSPYPVFGAFAVTTDTLLAMWEAYAVLCYIKAYRNNSRKHAKIWILGMWLFLGIGFFTKGPPSLLVLLPIILWNLWKRSDLKIFYPAGIMLFMISGLWWYTFETARHPELVGYFLYCEVGQRVFSSSMHNSEWYAPLIMYLPSLTLGAGIWLFYVLKMGIGIPKGEGISIPSLRNTGYGFLILWVMIPLIVFSLVKSRLWLYVLPLFCPVSIFMARVIIKSMQSHKDYLRKILISAYIAGITLMIVKGISSIYPNHNNMKQLHALVKAIRADDEEVVSFNQPKLFGLQFYLQGNLKRISTQKRPWADEDISSFLKRIKKEHRAKIIITEKKDEPLFKKIMKDAGISFIVSSTLNWTIIRTTKN